MSKFGIPYMGSKSRIAEWVVGMLPGGRCLVDLFAGGCAVTHCALVSRRWGRVISNDISDAPRVFEGAVRGEYEDEDRWISREDFFAMKDRDAYVRIMWSFGHDQRSYMYSREMEPYKRALHKMIYGRTERERRLRYVEVVERLREIGVKDVTMRGLMSLQSQERLERLQSLRGVVDLGEMEIEGRDYRDVEIPDNAVVYADPPYRGARGYGDEFNHEEFYEWVRRQRVPVYISEYWMPDDFTIVGERRIKSILSATNKSRDVVERIYGWNVEGLERSGEIRLITE